MKFELEKHLGKGRAEETIDEWTRFHARFGKILEEADVPIGMTLSCLVVACDKHRLNLWNNIQDCAAVVRKDLVLENGVKWREKVTFKENTICSMCDEKAAHAAEVRFNVVKSGT